MRESNYPKQWDIEVVPQYLEKTCNCEFGVKRTVEVKTEEFDYASGGYLMVTDNVNWESDYAEQHLNPVELIGEMERFLTGIFDSLSESNKKKAYNLLQECGGWEIEHVIVKEA